MQSFLICTVMISDMSHSKSRRVHWGPGGPTPASPGILTLGVQYPGTLHFAPGTHARTCPTTVEVRRACLSLMCACRYSDVIPPQDENGAAMPRVSSLFASVRVVGPPWGRGQAGSMARRSDRKAAGMHVQQHLCPDPWPCHVRKMVVLD